MDKIRKCIARANSNVNYVLTSKKSAIFYVHKLLKSGSAVKAGDGDSNSTSSSRSSSSNSSSSSSDSSSDDLKESPDPKSKSEEKMTKLNQLLMALIQQDKVSSESQLNLAQPKNRRIMGQNEKAKKPKSDEAKLATAAKAAAESVGGDVKQTESELLAKLLTTNEVSQNGTAPTKNLSDVIKGMSIDREVKTPEQSRADQIRQLIQTAQSKIRTEAKSEGIMKRPMKLQRKPEGAYDKINLFGSAPLGIFSDKSHFKEIPGNSTWTILHNRDLKLAVTHPPSNYFQQIILWTEQGKLWRFPIDNEQGIEEEKKVYFAQHIFLEEHLEPWCPPKGPLRHFMELVCVGLSKNHYLTVEAKKEHIEWYKNYFEEKKALLQELGALIPNKNITDGDKKTNS